MKIRNLTEESTTLEDCVHTDGTGNIIANKDKSYTSNTESTQNPRYNRSAYNTRYSRYKTNETNNRYRNGTHVEYDQKN